METFASAEKRAQCTSPCSLFRPRHYSLGLQARLSLPQMANFNLIALIYIFYILLTVHSQLDM